MLAPKPESRSLFGEGEQHNTWRVSGDVQGEGQTGGQRAGQARDRGVGGESQWLRFDSEPLELPEGIVLGDFLLLVTAEGVQSQGEECLGARAWVRP